MNATFKQVRTIRSLLRQSCAKIRKTGIGPKLFCFGFLEHAKFGKLNEQPNRYVVWNQRLFNVWVKEDQEILGENGRNHINRSRALAASQEKLPAPVGIYNPIQNCTYGHLLNSFFVRKEVGQLLMVAILDTSHNSNFYYTGNGRQVKVFNAYCQVYGP